MDAIGGYCEEGTERSNFSGIFDGQGHTISGLYNCTLGGEYGKPDSCVGLFGMVSNAVIKNLTVKDSYFYVYNSATAVSAIAASAYKTSFDSCKTDNVTIFANSAKVGGIAGECSYSADIKNCVADGRFEAGYVSYVAGITATITDGEVQNCTNNAYIIGQDDANAAGIVSFVSDTVPEEKTGKYVHKYCGYSNVTNCVNNGKIESNTESAGIVSHALSDSSSINISGCTNNGEVAAANIASGILAFADASESWDNISSINIDGCENAGAISCDKGVSGVAGNVSVSEMASMVISNCRNTASLESNDSVGGILLNIANNDASKVYVKNCENTGDLKADGAGCAGIVSSIAYANSKKCDGFDYQIIGCNNSGTITNTSSIMTGGIVGNIQISGCDADCIKISSCTNSGDFNLALDDSVVSHAGGILGSSPNQAAATQSITNCKNTGDFNITINNPKPAEDSEIKDDAKICYIGGIAGETVAGFVIKGSSNDGKVNVINGDDSRLAFDDGVALII